MAGLVAACGGSAATGAPGATGTQAGATKAAASAADKATAGAPKALDACALITADEAAAVLGKPVDPGVVPEPGANSCIFVDSALSTDCVEISITGLTITQVSGIGDAAYYVNMGMPYVVLNVRNGQSTFTTSVLLKGASESQVMAGEKSLALLILGRI